MNIQQHIDRLQEDARKANQELEQIEELRKEFPDLEITQDRWGHSRYMAKSANARVNQVMIHKNCGCCEDSPLHARPYLKLNNGILIYSNPCDSMVGSPNMWGRGFQEKVGWRKRYEDAGINPEIVERIQQHINYLLDEDEEE